VLQAPWIKTTSSAIRSSCGSDIDITIGVDCCHAGGFNLPIHVIILNYAKRVYPDEADLKSPDNGDSILEGPR
jgi:hypothetical protein